MSVCILTGTRKGLFLLVGDQSRLGRSTASC